MSDYLKDPMVLRQIILDHYQYPHHHELTNGEGYQNVHMASESCIDDIHVEAKIKDGVIEDINFEGVSCSLSTASTSIMTDLLIGKTVEEAKEIIDAYNVMIAGEGYDEDVLQEAVAFQNTYKQANRIKCATIGWKAIEEMIEESEQSDGNEYR